MPELDVVVSSLPEFVIIVPFLGCLLILISGNESTFSLIAILSNLAALLGLVVMIPTVSKGELVVLGLGELFSPFGLHFEVNRLGLFMAILSGFLWLLATVYSKAYLGSGGKQRRYYAFLELTLVGCLGVYLTQNLFTLFIFFEVLSLMPFVLVIHDQTMEALRAGNLYLFMTILGGLSLLLGLIILYSYTGSFHFVEIRDHLPESIGANLLIAWLFLVGFGVKAGMVGLHIWLPQAHPVAPTPASALLSGVMIKAGAYGVYLLIGQMFFHAGDVLARLGYSVIWVGLLTMLVGAVSALRQNDLKRMLAYSSISQMGYILLALGLAGYLGEHGTIGFMSAFYHLFNHAIFKVGFFLTVGMIYAATHEKRLEHLGGLYKAMPFCAGLFLIFGGGIVGVPGFNAYASKTLIHHVITEVIHEKGSGGGLGLVEPLFILTGAFTFAYMLKAFVGTFLGVKPGKLKVHPFPFHAMRRVTAPLGFLVVLTGWIPAFITHRLFEPLMQETGFDPHVAQEFFAHFSFWNWHDLSAVLPYFVIGGVLYWAEQRYAIFTRVLPEWFGIEQITVGVTKAVALGFQKAYAQVTAWITQAGLWIRKTTLSYADALIYFDRDPRSTRMGPISIASLDFSKFWLALVIVVFLLMSLLKMIEM